MESFSQLDCVLLVGEGNFSFSIYLFKRFGCKIIATDLKTQDLDQTTKSNVSFLKEQEQRVYLDVDATKLHENSLLDPDEVTHIIFNFPHAKCKKMKIGLNRQLLGDFFLSCKHFMAERDIKVHVSLCNGQSGIEEVEVSPRKWSDSWQINEQAADADFVLVKVAAFESDEYLSFGYRLTHKQFHVKDAKTFTFSKRSAFALETNKLENLFHSNLFTKSFVKEFLNEFKTAFPSTQTECKLDVNAKTFPFFKHFILINDFRDQQKLCNYFGGRLKFVGQNVFWKETVIGSVFEDQLKLELEAMAPHLFCIPDARIIYSSYFKNRCELSLFPRQHQHDISFWLSDDFTYEKLVCCAIDVFGVALKSIELIDTYQDLHNNTSMCYRLTVQSVDLAMSKRTCNRLQINFRDLLQKKCGVLLR